MRIHRHDGAIDFRHLTQAVIAAIVDRFDINEIADLHHLLRRERGRAHFGGSFDLSAGPGELTERHARMRSVGQSDAHAFVGRIAEHHGDAPGVDAGLIAHFRQRGFPIA